MADGVTIEQRRSAVNAMYRELHPPAPGDKPFSLPAMHPLTASALGSGGDDIRRFVLLLGGVVGLTLLIACANLANLLLARSANRRREVSVRLALGAGRAGVVRQMLAESVLLSAVGGAAGVAVAWVALSLLGAYELPGGLRIEGLGLSIDRVALATTAALALLTGLVFGAAPACARRAPIMVSLRDDLRATSARSGLRSTLVAAQGGLSVVLLTVSGHLPQKPRAVLNAPLGFNVDGVGLRVGPSRGRRGSMRRARRRSMTKRSRACRPDAGPRRGLVGIVPRSDGWTAVAELEGFAPPMAGH